MHQSPWWSPCLVSFLCRFA